MSKKILTLWALAASGLVQAQSFSDTAVLDPVTVTANKVQQRASTTGKIITIIDKATLQKNAGRSIAALLNETAGITLNGALNNAGTNQTVFMRGAASGRTLVLIDGIPVNDASQIGNEFDLNFLSVNDIERVEICRGAQSSIYGSDAVAGVINLITEKQGVQKKLEGKASLTAGNYGTYRQNLQLYGKVGKLQYSLRHAGLQSEGFSTATDTLGNRNYDKDRFRGISQASRLQYAASTALTFKAYVMRNSYQAGLDERIFTDDKQLNLDHALLNTGGGFQYQHRRFQLTGNYQFSQTDRNFNRDSADKTAFSYFVRNSFFSKGQFAELYASIPLTKTLKLLQGFEYRYNSMNSRYFAVSAFGPFTTQFRDTSVSQSSAYTHLLWQSQKGFMLDMGVRLNQHSQFGTYSTYTFNPSYAIGAQTRVFGSVATAFKAPSLFQLFDPFSGRADLKPERSTTVELGAEYKLAGSQHRLVVFHRNIKDGLDYDYVRNKYFNFFQQTAVGVELESSVVLAKGLRFTGNFTFLSIADSTQSRISFKDTAYAYGLRRPGVNLNLSLDYTYKGFDLRLSGKYVGSRYDVGGFRRADVLLGDYFLVNASAGYALNKRVRFFADAQNIGNARFFDIRGFNSIPFLLQGGVSLTL